MSIEYSCIIRIIMFYVQIMYGLHTAHGVHRIPYAPTAMYYVHTVLYCHPAIVWMKHVVCSLSHPVLPFSHVYGTEDIPTCGTNV